MKHCKLFIYARFILTILFIVSCFFYVQAQSPQINIPLPQPPTIIPNFGVNFGYPEQKKSPNPTSFFSFPGNELLQSQREYQEEIIRQTELLEQKHQQETRQILMQEYMKKHTIPLPDFTQAPGAGFFHAARKEIIDMLEGREKLSLKRAVFLTENAFFNNALSYEQFDAAIQDLKNICLLKMKEEGLSLHDDMAKKMMIFRVMSDQISVKEPGTEKTITHFPMKYDFDDYRGDEDKRKYMVSKLLAENSGQCHSMPLLFLILAEELGTEAYISYSPQHSFVKFKDDKNKWYDVELTQGAIVTDDFYMGSGFIKAEAIRNGLYLEPRDIRQMVAHTLNDLSLYYIERYDFDDFIRQNAEIVHQYIPNDLTAYTHLSNYHTATTFYILRTCEVPSVASLPAYPQAEALYNQMLAIYAQIDSLGYEEMPLEIYQNWLNRVNIEKEKPENQPTFVKQIKE